MKPALPPFYVALLLVAGCSIFRLLGSLAPTWMPNLSPLMALAFVGAIYLPRAWGWLVGPASLLITEVAFLPLNAATVGQTFSWWTLGALAVYALAGVLGRALQGHQSIPALVAGSVTCSILFYLVANTFAFAGNLALAGGPGYPATFAGWVQANTVGLPGWTPTWVFLRHGILGDLFFTGVLVLIFDRAWLLSHVSARLRAGMA